LSFYSGTRDETRDEAVKAVLDHLEGAKCVLSGREALARAQVTAAVAPTVGIIWDAFEGAVAELTSGQQGKKLLRGLADASEDPNTGVPPVSRQVAASSYIPDTVRDIVETAVATALSSIDSITGARVSIGVDADVKHTASDMAVGSIMDRVENLLMMSEEARATVTRKVSVGVAGAERVQKFYRVVNGRFGNEISREEYVQEDEAFRVIKWYQLTGKLPRVVKGAVAAGEPRSWKEMSPEERAQEQERWKKMPWEDPEVAISMGSQAADFSGVEASYDKTTQGMTAPMPPRRNASEEEREEYEKKQKAFLDAMRQVEDEAEASWTPISYKTHDPLPDHTRAVYELLSRVWQPSTKSKLTPAEVRSYSTGNIALVVAVGGLYLIDMSRAEPGADYTDFILLSGGTGDFRSMQVRLNPENRTPEEDVSEWEKKIAAADPQIARFLAAKKPRDRDMQEIMDSLKQEFIASRSAPATAMRSEEVSVTITSASSTTINTPGGQIMRANVERIVLEDETLSFLPLQGQDFTTDQATLSERLRGIFSPAFSDAAIRAATSELLTAHLADIE
jgi:hypothetical protein